MKKVKEWLNNRKIDDKIRQELRQVLINKIGFEPNSKQTRDRAVIIANVFLRNLHCDFEYVKCDEENNSPDVIDSGHMVVHILENLRVNGTFKIHKIRL